MDFRRYTFLTLSDKIIPFVKQGKTSKGILLEKKEKEKMLT